MKQDCTYLVHSDLRLKFESLKLVQRHLFETRMLGKSHIAVNKELRAASKCIGEHGLASFIQLEMELNYEKRGENGQSLRILIASSAYTSGLSPLTSEDPILESSFYIKPNGCRTSQQVAAFPSFYKVN